ncbi:MAG: VIT and VWA domain-containing protein, partial [Bryobacteraceae bacterium]|nr:VIT and VWA domain-containing protein [Bryobacteraceae bacterium]
MATATEEQVGYAPRCARSGQPIRLAMQRLWLTGRVLPVGARLFVHHVFRSQEQNPLEVIYSFALPRDAALRRFQVRGEGFSVRSELKAVEEAVRVYEEGLARGHLTTLARHYRDGIVNLTLGNLRPGETVVVSLELLAGVEIYDDGLRFRFPFTLAPCYHPQARAVESEPGTGEMELPEEEFDDLILPQWRTDSSSLHEVGFQLAVDAPLAIAETWSPSHAVRVVRSDPKRARVRLAPERDVPDRDFVLDARWSESFEGALAGLGSDGRGRFAAVVPSKRFGEPSFTSRRLVFLLDRSGSMSGQPMQQAKRACEACLATLSPEDEFGIVVFDNVAEVFRDALVKADGEARDAARTFLARVEARGGTELAAGIERAAAMLSHGGDLFVITDGQVYATEPILARARSAGVRVHCLGIGSASQDRFLTLLARQTGGVGRFVTPRERVDAAALELFAAAGRPVAEQIEARTEGLAGGRVAPEPPPAVFPGRPLVLFGDADGPGRGSLRIIWQKGPEPGCLSLPVEIGTANLGEPLRLLHGARLIADLESQDVSDSEGWRERRGAGRV